MAHLRSIRWLSLAWLVAACSPSAGTSKPGAVTGAGGSGASPADGSGGVVGFGSGGDVGFPSSGGGGGSTTCTGTGCSSDTICGNAVIGDVEQCDDGNTTPDDGCSDKCEVEPGWLCPGAGLKCGAKSCGDGIAVGTEQCDDGNTIDGDGCTPICANEFGWACAPGNPAVCHPTTCGDGTTEGFEQCDDGNRIPYDGCSPACKLEPKCAGGQCTAVCGDGLKFPQEECDDGNTRSGDGCSATCIKEDGFKCETVTLAPPDQLFIPILYRDFLYSGTTTPGMGHPDFQSKGGSKQGLVERNLGADGKPVLAAGADTGIITSADTFYWWYHDQNCSTGTCVPNPYEKLVYLDKAGAPTTLTFGRLPSGAYQFASTAFFPLNGLGWGTVQTDFFGNNFSFTSELRYQFTYAGGEVLQFVGDDDVYVFINGVLAVDLGGLHSAKPGSITLDAAAATNLGLTVGGMYEIVLFQAERHTDESNYTLTLTGFEHAVTACTSICGDGVVTYDEACDDGPDNSVTGACMPDCRARGSYCGDGKVDESHGEQCDGTPNCSAGCRIKLAH